MGQSSLKSRLRQAWIKSQNLPLGEGKFLTLPAFRVIEPRLNLLIIGSGKCGTTSLHAWLGQHPDIFMSAPLKEPEYFAPPGFQSPNRLANASQTDLMRLMIQGYRPARYFGEASPVYTSPAVYEHNPNPQIVRRYNPDTRLIYSIRNPIERIVSHFNQDIFQGRMKPASTIPEDEFPRYLRAASFGRQLSNWADHFPREQIKVVLLEEFADDPAPTLRAITDFLDLPPFPDGMSFEGRNVTAKREKPPQRVCFTDEQFERALAHLRPDIQRLEDYVGRQVSAGWDLGRERWRAA